MGPYEVTCHRNIRVLEIFGSTKVFRCLARNFAAIGPAGKKKTLHAQHIAGQCSYRLYDNIRTHQILLSQDPVDALGQ